MFVDNAIDAEILPKLTADDLKDMGIALVGHRRKLMAAIDELRDIERPAQSDFQPVHATRADSFHLGLGRAAERRRVTVMFYDLVGSTALSTRIDPEELREVIGPYHRRLAEVITRFGGFVARIL